MASQDMQRLADANEDDAARRYLRGKLMVGVVAEAMRRSDAMSRLDACLLRVTRPRAI